MSELSGFKCTTNTRCYFDHFNENRVVRQFGVKTRAGSTVGGQSWRCGQTKVKTGGGVQGAELETKLTRVLTGESV